MKLSPAFFLEKLRARYPDITRMGNGDELQTVEGVSVLLPQQEPAAGILYVDLQQQTSAQPPVLVTTRSRASRYPNSCVLALPDEVSPGEVLEQVTGIWHSCNRWAEEICRAVAGGAPLQTLIDLTAKMGDNPMYIADRSWKVLAYQDLDMYDTSATWRYQRKYGYLPYDVMQKLVQSGELERMNTEPRAFRIESSGFAVPFVCKPIRKDGDHHGYFFIIELYRRLNICDITVADYLGELLAASVHNRQNYLEISERYHVHFIADMLRGTLTDLQLIRDQGRALQMDPEGDYVLFLMAMEQDTEANRRHLMSRLSAEAGMVCLEYGKQVVGILRDCSSGLEAVLDRLRAYARRYRVFGAVSERFVCFAELRSYYAQAEFAIEYGRRRNLPPQLLLYRDAYMDHLTALSDSIPLFSFVERLDRYDKQHGTEYCRTLYVWLVCERNIVRSAKALYLHRNTMKYRLDRIAALVPLNTDELEVRIRLLLSLRQLLRERGESLELTSQ